MKSSIAFSIILIAAIVLSLPACNKPRNVSDYAFEHPRQNVDYIFLRKKGDEDKIGVRVVRRSTDCAPRAKNCIEIDHTRYEVFHELPVPTREVHFCAPDALTYIIAGDSASYAIVVYLTSPAVVDTILTLPRPDPKYAESVWFDYRLLLRDSIAVLPPPGWGDICCLVKIESENTFHEITRNEGQSEGISDDFRQLYFLDFVYDENSSDYLMQYIIFDAPTLQSWTIAVPGASVFHPERSGEDGYFYFIAASGNGAMLCRSLTGQSIDTLYAPDASLRITSFDVRPDSGTIAIDVETLDRTQGSVVTIVIPGE